MWKWSLTVAVLLAGCEWAKQEPIVLPEVSPDTVVLSWAMVNRGASGDTMYMALYGNRKMEVITKSPNGSMARVEQTLSRKKVSKVVAEFRALDCCALRSGSETAPSPRESQPELTIDFGDVKCDVTLWDSEWREGRADACRAAVAALHGRGELHHAHTR